jgi:imidazolonepropionase
MKFVLINIKDLLQIREGKIEILKGKALQNLPSIKNAWLEVENGIISKYGSMDNFEANSAIQTIDCSGKIVMPTWVDSHTHLVYAGNRESEFVDRIKGLTYAEIAEKGGGIINSAEKLQQTSEEELYQQSKIRLHEVISQGTGAIEIKSGYGLTKEAEMKMLRVAKRLQQEFDLPIKTTFLGAHALPKKFNGNTKAYIDEVINEMLPAIAAENLADFIDIFCEKNYFELEDTQRIIEAGKKYGLPAKIHVNQFTSFGGLQLCAEQKVLSVDHLEVLTDEDIQHLKKSTTLPVALPSCSFFLEIPYTPARKLIENNLAVVLASDYNPGSTPSGNMNFVVSLACIKMKMTPEEAINAATINAAFAMQVEDKVGSITKGKLANLIITKPINSYSFLPYSFGSNHIEEVYLKGKPQIHTK